jgi:hypothetical protein
MNRRNSAALFSGVLTSDKQFSAKKTFERFPLRQVLSDPIVGGLEALDTLASTP